MRRGRGMPCRLGILAGALLTSTAALAEVSTDGTLGRRVRLTGKDVEVGAELGQTRGGNLFHSFQRFGVERGGRVTFTGPGGLDNVISRVTGGETSRIDGTLASRVEGAGVWLVNPSGIVFGPGARLDVPGSFHAGAAAEVRFPDGTAFGARDAAASRLSVAAPEGFGFLGDRTDGLVVAGAALRVPRGEILTLAGAAGVLVAGGGPAGIVAAEAGRVEVDTPGDVFMLDRAFLDASGDGAGTVRVRAGGTLVVEGFSALNADNLGPTDARPGAGIAIEAGEGVTVASGSRVSADARGAGRGAGIDVATPGPLRVESRGVDAMTVIAAEGF